MKTVSVTEFKAKCLGLIAEVRETGEGLTITHRGKPVVDVSLHRGEESGLTEEQKRDRYRPGQAASWVRIVGDLELTPEEAGWDLEMEALGDSVAPPPSVPRPEAA